MVDTKDRAALNASILENYQILLRFLRSKVADADFVADVAQEAYARMLASYGPVSLAEKPSLLVKVAHNIVRERALKTKRTDGGVSVSFDELDAQLADPLSGETPESKFNAWLLKRAILDLPPRCKEVFVLHRFKVSVWGTSPFGDLEFP